LIRWGTELAVGSGLAAAPGFHLVIWSHDETCPLNPIYNARHALATTCRCQPDGVLLLDVGGRRERQVPIVVEGVAILAGAPG
jgi:hypothetical protein